MRLAIAAAAGVTALAALVAATPASAKCTRLGFSVNDYGKDGPIKDAKALLDKYVAKWAAENGIKTYKIGKKEVSCELFLDFVVFDEHTCKATASVCWPDGQGPKVIQVEGTPGTPVAKKKAAAARPQAPAKAATADAAAPSPAPAAPAAPAAAAPASPGQPKE